MVKKVNCKRTKTEAIITNVLAPHALDKLINKLQTNVDHFSISTDASNHGSQKLFPLLVQYFCENNGIEVKLLELEALTSETSLSIGTYIHENLQKHNLLSKCIAYSGDNANLNFGGSNQKEGNNVFTHLKNTVNEDMIGVKCPAHIVHNTVQHGSDCLPFYVESMVMKIHNFFHIYCAYGKAQGLL